MKKYAISLFALVLAVASCNKESQYLFDAPINARTEALINNYKNILTSAPNGWIAYYTPDGNEGRITIHFKFDKNNVAISSDYKNGLQDGETTYRIDKQLKLELVFESHSVLSAVYNIQSDNEGEFVFNILEANSEKVTLQSKTDNGYNDEVITILELVPAPDTVSEMLGDLRQMQDNIIGPGPAASSVWRRYITVSGNSLATFFYGSNTRTATLRYLDEKGISKSLTVPVSVSGTGFQFTEKVVIDGKTLDSFIWNATTEAFEDVANKAEWGHNSQKPLFPITPHYDFGKEDDKISLTASFSNFDLIPLSFHRISIAFNDFYTTWEASFFDILGSVDIIGLSNMDDTGQPAAYIEMKFFEHTVRFGVTYTITKDALGNSIVTFTPTEIKDDSEQFDDVVIYTVTKDALGNNVVEIKDESDDDDLFGDDDDDLFGDDDDDLFGDDDDDLFGDDDDLFGDDDDDLFGDDDDLFGDDDDLFGDEFDDFFSAPDPALFQPWVDFMYRPEGFYFIKMEKIPGSTNNILGMVPVDDPTILAQWIATDN